MATFEQIQLIFDVVRNIEGLRRDARDNAQGYKNAVTSGKAISEIIAIMNEDANEYLRRLQWLRTVVDTPAKRTKLLAGLAVFGVTEAEAIALYQELKASADATIAATLTTAQDINNRADAILTSEVLAHDTLW